MRDFEKISFDQFKKDIDNNIELYNNYELPQRDSDGSAGYDIYLLKDIEIQPNEILKIPTGIKSYFDKNEVLLLVVRSSTGFKYNIRLCNQLGIVDSDYYNNESNEGHIWIKVQNEGKEKASFKKDDALVQGLFMNYLTIKSDKNNKIKRTSDY